VTVDLPEKWYEPFRKLLVEQKEDYRSLIRRGNILLLLGKYKEAEAAFLQAHGNAGTPEERKCALLHVCKVYYGMDHHPRRARALHDYVTYGPAGWDGIIGSLDDPGNTLPRELVSMISNRSIGQEKKK
jgi:hypothetical protein